MTSFDHHIGEETKAIFDRIWVEIPRHNHTLSLNNIIASIHCGNEQMLSLEK